MTEENIFIFRSCARLHLRQFELYYRNTVNKTALYSFLSTGLLLSYKNQPQVVGSITQLNKSTIFPRGERQKKKKRPGWEILSVFHKASSYASTPDHMSYGWCHRVLRVLARSDEIGFREVDMLRENTNANSA